MTTVFDAAGEASAKASWVLMRRTRADTFRSASSRKNLYCFSKLHVAEPKNRTCIGPHSRTQKYQRFPSWKPAMSGGLKLPETGVSPHIGTGGSDAPFSAHAITAVPFF